MTDEVLRRQARRQLDRLVTPTGAEIGRAVFEVTVEGRTEWVTLTFREGKLTVTSTDGQSEGPHAAAALRMLASTTEIEPGPELREETSPGAVVVAADPLCDALKHLVTSVARIGCREALGSPTVEDAVARILAAAGDIPSVALARWVGRLRSALASQDAFAVAQLLSGAIQLTEAMEAKPPSAEQLERIQAWLGSATSRGAIRAVHDRVWIEIARESVAALRPAQLQRRYLLDPQSGEIFREERLLGAPPLSLGPCPRRIAVAFAEIEQGPAPRRVRIYQYAVSPTIDDAIWADVAGVAERSFSALARNYRQTSVEYPGLVEPFVLVAPASWERIGGLVPADETGDTLPVARGDAPGVVDVLARRVAEREPRWVAGHLGQLADGLVLFPYAIGGTSSKEYVRLR